MCTCRVRAYVLTCPIHIVYWQSCSLAVAAHCGAVFVSTVLPFLCPHVFMLLKIHVCVFPADVCVCVCGHIPGIVKYMFLPVLHPRSRRSDSAAVVLSSDVYTCRWPTYCSNGVLLFVTLMVYTIPSTAPSCSALALFSLGLCATSSRPTPQLQQQRARDGNSL